MIKLKRIKNFLKDRDKVRVTVIFRGREAEHKERGVGMVDKIVSHLGRLATIENRPQIAGNRLVTILAPGK